MIERRKLLEHYLTARAARRVILIQSLPAQILACAALIASYPILIVLSDQHIARPADGLYALGLLGASAFVLILSIASVEWSWKARVPIEWMIAEVSVNCLIDVNEANFVMNSSATATAAVVAPLVRLIEQDIRRKKRSVEVSEAMAADIIRVRLMKPHAMFGIIAASGLHNDSGEVRSVIWAYIRVALFPADKVSKKREVFKGIRRLPALEVGMLRSRGAWRRALSLGVSASFLLFSLLQLANARHVDVGVTLGNLIVQVGVSVISGVLVAIVSEAIAQRKRSN